MVTDLWTFIYPLGYNGKIELWPIKSRNEDTVTLGPVASICATPASRQTDKRKDEWMEGQMDGQMLGYVMSFAYWQVSKAK